MSGETWWKKRKKEAAGKIGDLIRRIRLRRRRKEKGNESGCGKEAEAPWENPFLAYSRQVMEAVLRRKGMDYRAFRPIVIDTDMPGQHFGGGRCGSGAGTDGAGIKFSGDLYGQAAVFY